MANFTIPNRPAATDVRHIADILGDFDTVTGILDSVTRDRKRIWGATVWVPGALAAGTWVIANGVLQLSGTSAANSFEWMYIDNSDWASYPGKTLGFFMRLSVAQGVTPALAFTLGLAPLTVGGAGGGISATAGTPVAGSAISVSEGSNSTIKVDGSGAPFTVVNGAYVPYVQFSPSTATNSATVLRCEMFVTYR